MKKKRILAGMIFALTITVNGCQSNQSAKKTAETTASPIPTVAVVDLPETMFIQLLVERCKLRYQKIGQSVMRMPLCW